MHNVRYSVRSLLQAPGFSLIVIAVLGLGIGASTAIFSFVYGALLRPLPYPGADRIVVPATVFSRYHTDRGSVSCPDFLDWRAQTDLFEGVSLLATRSDDLTGIGEPQRISRVDVSEDYFLVMAAPPLLGRTFALEEHNASNNRVVVLSHDFWMGRFGGDPKIIGATVDLSGTPHKIVGVMPKDGTWPAGADVFKPLGFRPQPPQWTLRRDNHVFNAIARLRPGVTVEQAQARLTAMAARIAREETNRAGTGWKLHRLSNWIVGPDMPRILIVLMAAVGLLLLIACVNVANLLLARSSVREREIAIRAALGAGQARLLRLFATESALLGASAALAGVGFACALMRILIHFAPREAPRLADVKMDNAVLAFAAAVSVLTVFAFGLLPALSAIRRARPEAFREATQAGAGGVQGQRTRSALVIAEVALTTVLLVGAGLLIGTFVRLLAVNPGFAAGNVLTMEISLPYPHARVAGAFEEIAGSLRGIPGVTSASATSALPLYGGGFYLGRVFLAPGQPEPPAGKDTNARWTVVQAGLLSTLGMRIVRGRDFDSRDSETAPPVAIISESMAREAFPNADPIGKRLRSWRDENVYREIVGIASDTYYELTAPPQNLFYVPHRQDTWHALVIVLRTQGDPYALLPAVRSTVWAKDAKLAIAEVKTMDEVLTQALAVPRFVMFLMSVFAGLALLLAIVGLYGVMSYVVARRTREFGIRLALGAGSADLVRSVLSRAASLTVGGLAIGLIAAGGLTRLISTLLFGISPRDPATFAAIAVILLAVALAACVGPALRAARVDPVTTLRCN